MRSNPIVLLAPVLGVALFVLTVLAGCSGSGSGGGAPAEELDLETSLNQLGISTTPTPRLSNDGVALPDDYAPYGARTTMRSLEDGSVAIASAQEIVLVGCSLELDPANGINGSFATVIDNFEIPDTLGAIDPHVVDSFTSAEAPWALDVTGGACDSPLTLRHAAGNDVDGDGFDELVVTRIDGGDLVIEVHHFDEPGLAADVTSMVIPVDLTPIGGVRVAAGDLDADGISELVVFLVEGPDPMGPSLGRVFLLDDATTGFAELATIDVQSELDDIAMDVVLEVGNIDYDLAEEWVLVVNEVAPNVCYPSPAEAATRFFVHDDISTGSALLFEDFLDVETPEGFRTALSTDVAIGDFDGDDVNEMVFAGITGDDGFCDEFLDLRLLAATYEFDGMLYDRTHASASTDIDSVYHLGSCQDNGPYFLRSVSVNAVDLNGDRTDEIQVNQFVFSGLPPLGTSWTAAAGGLLEDFAIFADDSGGTQVFDPRSASIVVGDPNGDGKEELLTYRYGNDRVAIWGLRETGDFGYRAYFEVVEDFDATWGQVGWNPLLIPLDADSGNEGDVQRLEFVEHLVDFTEPVILAVMAAPPSVDGIAQNHDACTTTWGRFESVGVEGERETTFSVGGSLGVSVEYDAGAGFVVDADTRVFAFEAKITLTRESGRIHTESYEVTKEVSFETGPQEDSVVFSSIPYDVYIYRVIETNLLEDGQLEQVEMTYRVGVPREPIVRIATVDYYSAHTTSTAVPLDAIFGHTIGDPSTYPTVAQREATLAVRRSQVEESRSDCDFCWQLDPDDNAFFNGPFRTFDPLEALPGLVSNPVGVGEGSGATEVSIELSVENGEGRHASTSTEIELELIIGPILAGFQIGGGISWSTTLSRGSGTSYVGSVGSITGQDFTENHYQFGLFTYLYRDPWSGQEFEVLNYWVQ